MSKKTVVFDFDGVVHKYSKGWCNGVIYDSPNENVREAIKQLRLDNYKVVIVSTRCSDSHGTQAIKDWLIKNNIEVDDVCMHKPPAIAYIDDRAIKYDPLCTNLVEQIESFNPDLKQIDELYNMNELELLNQLYQLSNNFKILNDKFDNKYPTNSDSKESIIIHTRLLQEWIRAVQKYL